MTETLRVKFLSATNPAAVETRFSKDQGHQTTRTLLWQITEKNSVSYVTLETISYLRAVDHDDHDIPEDQMTTKRAELEVWLSAYFDETLHPTDEDADAWAAAHPAPLWFTTGVHQTWYCHTHRDEPRSSATTMLLTSTPGREAWTDEEHAQEIAAGHLSTLRPGLVDPMGRKLLTPLA